MNSPAGIIPEINNAMLIASIKLPNLASPKCLAKKGIKIILFIPCSNEKDKNRKKLNPPNFLIFLDDIISGNLIKAIRNCYFDNNSNCLNYPLR